jgi:hypothetical protein
VTETTQPSRAVGNGGGLTRRPGPLLLAGAFAVMLLASAVAGYLYGLNLTYAELASARQSVQELRPENQRLKNSLLVQNANIVELQSELARVRAALHAILPSENTYKISPNQSVIVADGHLIIGLVGSPGNDSVKINVNGKLQTVTTGDVIRVEVDPSINCQAGIQSFDMFNVIVTASCAASKAN